jgi:hypothetical protein
MRCTSLRAIFLAFLGLLSASAARAQTFNAPVPGYAYPGSGPGWLEGWAGGGVSNNWQGGWAGFNYAFNHNVWSDGILLRGEGGGGHYNYTQPNPPIAGLDNVTYGQGAVLLGYRKIIPGFLGVSTTFDGFVGAEVQDHRNNDPFADVKGTQWGAKFVGDMYTRFSQYQDFFGMATFSFAFDTWLLIARPGFLLTSPGSTEVWIGPEMQVFGAGHGWLQNLSGCNSRLPPTGTPSTGTLGSCKYDEGRIGGFVHLVIPNQPLWGDWLLSGGYRKPLLGGSTGDGYYVQLGLNFRLQ